MKGLESTDPRQVGRYRITGRLGAGGMGRVYLGHSPSGRLVAVKVVRPELAEDPGFRRRFAREVAAARKVTGFFTAALVDADPDDGVAPWLATAYVPGLPLDEAVTAHGPWPADSVRALGAGLAEALEAIHAAGLVHRDLKPSNVLIAPDGPRVVDFGISVAAEATALTRTGMVVGTPGFMAPEQLTGKPVTAATDVFALGAVLTYAATGTGPFGTGSAQSLNFRIAYEEPDLSGLPSSGLEIIARCLAKDPAERPAVAALVEQLATSAPAAEGHPPTEATWLPAQLSRALPATVTAPTPPHPPVAPAHPPGPTPPPSSPAWPAATRPTPPWPPAAPPYPHGYPYPYPFPYPPPAAAQRSHVPVWMALTALALAMILPFLDEDTLVSKLGDGPRLLTIAIALSAATCVATLSARGRAPRLAARILHTITTILTTGMCVLLFTDLADDQDLDRLGPGGWAFALACAALLHTTVRFPTLKPPPTR